MPTTIDGLVTGIDTSKLIDGLLAVGRRRIELLTQDQQKISTRQTAFKGIEARLLALQTEVSRLGRSQNSVFDARKVSSSSEDLVKAAASSSAVGGTYTLKVNSLARAHVVASQGFDDPNSTITQGTLQIRAGSGATTTITIDGTNNTLRGLINAINTSGAEATASLVQDGSDSRTQPSRLLITANKPGADNAITIINSLGADSGSARRPVFDQTFVGPAVAGTTYTGTSTPTANTGAGGYTGTANDTYRFTVVSGGTVGTTNGIQISYVDGSGENSGTITLNSADADVFKSVAEGLQVKLSAGTLVAGQTFTIDAFVPTVQQAANASVTVGSGSGALTVQSATNQVDGLIGGVTLSLLGADSNKEVKLTVTNDTDAAKKAVLDFVNSYNDLLQFIDDQVRYDAQTKQAGVLLGDRSATTIEDDVRRVVSELVNGVNGQMNRLGALGITTNAQGRLEVNDTKLSDALDGRLTGVAFDDVRRLFALAGQSSNGGVQFVTGSTRTKASTTPHQVEISQAAEQGSITATSALAASTVIDGTNNTLTISVDGKASSTITLAAGTYTRLALAQELQAKTNANTDLTGRKVSVSLNGDSLVITSSTYGLASEVKIGSGTALTPLGFAGTESDRGQDVVGKFIVNGVDEPATGTGQFLVGSATNSNTADLQVRVTLAAGQLQAGAEANLTVTRGIASRLDAVLGILLDPVTGRLKAANDGFQSQIDDIKESVTRQNEILESRRQSLLRQFTAMERAVSQLRSTSDFLSAQLVSATRLRQQQG